MFVCVLSSASISIFYPFFKLLYHLKYIKSHIESFPQGFRYEIYFELATSPTLVIVLEAEQF